MLWPIGKIFVNILRNYLELIHLAHTTSYCQISDSDWCSDCVSLVKCYKMLHSHNKRNTSFTNIERYLRKQSSRFTFEHYLGFGTSCWSSGMKQNIYLTSCQCDKHHNIVNLDQLDLVMMMLVTELAVVLGHKITVSVYSAHLPHHYNSTYHSYNIIIISAILRTGQIQYISWNSIA